MDRLSELHAARHRLFVRGVARGHLAVDEIDAALPLGSLSAAERWLIYYSLNAVGVEVRFTETSERQSA